MTPVELDRGEALRLLEQMILLRRFEEKSAEVYGLQKIRGFLHLYIGEEAVAVGAMAALDAQDPVVATYREHGHALVRGVSPAAVMAEMYGKATGCARGRGGSMHLFDVGRAFYGGYAIVGGGLPIAVGLALADKTLGRPRVTACFFGDGATAEGEFHESLNLAALWRLPVLLLCENNLYAMGTAIERYRAGSIADQATAAGVPSARVDGMDVLAVLGAARRAAGEVRQGLGPRLLELRTYRFRAHSMYDPDRYRDKAEVASWKARDPIPRLGGQLRELGWIDDASLAAIEARVARAVDDAVLAAEEVPLEPVADLDRDLYAQVIP